MHRWFSDIKSNALDILRWAFLLILAIAMLIGFAWFGFSGLITHLIIILVVLALSRILKRDG
jgi:hypothetical protein